jgi:hypothetical protein
MYKMLLAAYQKIKNQEITEEEYKKMVQEFQFETYDNGWKDGIKNTNE